MALFQNPFSLEIPVKIGVLDVVFFINENLFVTNAECISYPHNHHDYEMRYVASGTCNQEIENKVYTVSAGELLLVSPFEYHCQTQNSEKSPSSQYNLRFYVEAPLPENTLRQRAYIGIVNLLNNTRQLYDKESVLLPYFQKLSDEIYNKEVGYVGNLQSLCCLILTELIRLSQHNVAYVFPAVELKYRGYERTTIDEFFRRQYLTDVKIQELANDMKVSVRQVNRIIHRMFGMSFTQKLTEMRLWAAAHQMINTKKPISQISAECGFKNYNTFFVSFQKKYNMSPTKFQAVFQSAQKHNHRKEEAK